MARRTFEALSCAQQWICIHKLQVTNMSHILDDLIFFLHNATHVRRLCHTINLPVKRSKTVFPQPRLILHGIEVDTSSQTMKPPQAKLQPHVERLKVTSKRKKVCLTDLLSVIGTLNFSGRTFLRRLIDPTVDVTNPLHRIRLTCEARKDLAAWLLFMRSFMSFLLVNWTSSDVLYLASDASGFAFGAVFKKSRATSQDIDISIKNPARRPSGTHMGCTFGQQADPLFH